VPQDGTKCATGRHKMCHRTAQNVPQDGTKCATERHKKTFSQLAAKNLPFPFPEQISLIVKGLTCQFRVDFL
jgi:hypothetical protein